jgi:hypothetical protein
MHTNSEVKHFPFRTILKVQAVKNKKTGGVFAYLISKGGRMFNFTLEETRMLTNLLLSVLQDPRR